MITDHNDARDRADIEITPDMKHAGASVLESLLGVVDSEFLVSQVYTAMAQTISLSPLKQKKKSRP